MKVLVALAAACLLAACSTPGGSRRDAPPAPLTGASERQGEARAIAVAQKATTLYDADSAHAAASSPATTPPAGRSNLAQIRAQIAENRAAFSDGRWMARQLDGQTWQVIYAYKLNNLDYSYRFIVDLANGKVRLS